MSHLKNVKPNQRSTKCKALGGNEALSEALGGKESF